MEERIPVGEAPQLIIKHIGGSLSLHTWDRREIQLRSDEEESHIQVSGQEQVLYSTNGDCIIHAPVDTELQITTLHGDGQISGVLGAITIDTAHGNLHLRHAGELEIQAIHGDLSLHHVQGSVQLELVGGNAEIGDVEGNLQVEGVGGDLHVRHVRGAVNAHCRGSCSVEVALVEGEACHIHAGGDIHCRVPNAIDADVQLKAGGDILVKGAGSTKTRAQGRHEFTMGQGGTPLHLTAGGSIVLTSQVAGSGSYSYSYGFEDEFGERAAEMAQRITEQVERQMANVSRHLEGLDERLSRLANSDEIAARVQQKVQAAMRKAEEKIAEATRDAERRARTAERQAAKHEARQRRVQPGWAPPPPPPPKPLRPKKDPVSEQERLMVLRMVEEGKISVEQAEKLLAALGGE
jgi:hypothetical protein